MRLNKKGFTLVEILAVVVILGIIMVISVPAVSKWIDRGKAESKESQKSTLVMAAQSYAQGNSTVLPKAIGQTTIITAKELKNANFLKEDLYDADKKRCMDSIVRIYKYNKSGYTYTAYIYCEGDTVPNDFSGVEPSISIGFSGNKQADDTIHDVSISSFKATIDGGSNGSIKYGIDGYSYSISVRYTTDPNEQAIEIYNSGSLNGGGREVLVIEKNLSEYTDITKVNEFIITVEAYNRDGGHKKVTVSSTYHDTDRPICGKVTGEAAEGSWLTKIGSKRTISVACSDGEGSGCTKSVFTKTFDEQMEYGTIPITDNAGNTTQCKVRVNIDWTYPTLTVDAYRRSDDGNYAGNIIGTVTASHSTPNHSVILNTYTNLVGGWFNRANYPDGVTFVFTVSDNILVASGGWYYNKSGIYNENANNIETYNEGSKKTFTETDRTVQHSLTAEGMRRARYDFKDAAGNLVKVYINANIDRTDPNCDTSKSHRNTVDGVTVDITCNDEESKCSSSNTLKYTEQKMSTTYSVADNAGNIGYCGVTVYSQRQSRSRTCGTANSCAEAGCTSYSGTCHCVAYNVYTNKSFSGWSSCPGNAGCRNSICGSSSAPMGGTQSSCSCKSYNRNYDKCGCEKWNPWGAWGNVSSCSSGDTIDCRTLYS